MELRRSLSFADGVALVVGTIVGIGVFFTPGRVAAEAGSAPAALLAWAVGGVVALLGAATYAALGEALPRTGGPYVYLREAFGARVAFLYGFLLLGAIMTGALALIGLVFVDHLGRFLPMAGGTRQAAAVAVILGLGAVNAVGVSAGARLQNAATVLKVLALLFLVAAGLGAGREPLVQRAAGGGGVGGFVSALVGVLFSYGGWQNLSNVSGEMRDARRDLPRAVVTGVVCVTALYLAAAAAYLHALPIEELAASPAPAAAALEAVVGPRAGDLTALFILVSAFGILNGLTLAGPRVFFAMARDGLLPGAVGRVHPRFRTPSAAIGLQSFLAVALLLLFGGRVAALTDYVVFADWLFFTLNGAALFRLVALGKAAPRRTHGWPWAPATFTAVSAALTLGILVGQWANARVGLGILAVGLVVYEVVARAKRTT